MQRAVLLDVVVRESAVIDKLLAGEDEALLVGGDAFFVLDLGLDGVDGVGALRHEGDVFAGQSPDKDLHAAAQAKHKVQRGFCLHLVIVHASLGLKLLASVDEALLDAGRTFLTVSIAVALGMGIPLLDLTGDGFKVILSAGLASFLQTIQRYLDPANTAYGVTSSSTDKTAKK